MGKLMEKAGGVLKNEGLQEKGAAKRSAAGAGNDFSSSGNTDSYGSGNNNDNY